MKRKGKKKSIKQTREDQPIILIQAPPEPQPEPWETWDLPPLHERDPKVFYGPHPDSPEGIAAAKRLHERSAGTRRYEQETEEQRNKRRGLMAFETTPLSIPQSTSRLRRSGGDEPPRMYVVRRLHIRANLIEMLTADGEWTLDLHEAEVGQAHQLRVPEDDEFFQYESLPVDYLLWQAQRERADVEFERALINLP